MNIFKSTRNILYPVIDIAPHHYYVTVNQAASHAYVSRQIWFVGLLSVPFFFLHFASCMSKSGGNDDLDGKASHIFLGGEDISGALTVLSGASGHHIAGSSGHASV